MLNRKKKEVKMAKDTSKVKAAMIAATTAALDYKNKNIKASDEEVIGHIVKISEQLMKNIE